MPDMNNNFKDLAIPVKDKTGDFQFVRIDSLDSVDSQPTVPAPPASQPVAQPAGDQATARYYVDSEDEQEVAQLTPQGVTISPDELQKEAVMITEVLHPELANEEKDRFAKITFSLLKGIRNPRQAREVFMREPSLGGMGIEEPRAQKFVDQIMAKKNVIYNKLKGAQLGKDIAPPQKPAADQKVEDIYDASQASPSQVQRDMLVTEVKPRGETASFVPKPVRAGDISYSPKGRVQPVGPVEEMGSLTLADFRRLAKSSADAAQRIYQKIELLADESLELKAQAIKSWKKSPVYQDYLAIGHKSMEGESSVDDIIKNKLVNDMTMEEFHIISDLNKSLQF